MKNIAIITARGGSKRIPRKNIKNFLGKPIVSYSIEAALQSGLFDVVMVSTDDQEIAEVAKSFGASIPFMRSKENSDDFSSTADVILEVATELQKQGKPFDNICCIYPTAPFITVDKLKESYALMIDKNYDTVFPVMQFGYPILRSLKMEDNKVSMNWPEYLFSRSQDLPPAYHDCGQFYWLNVERFTESKKLFTQNSGSIIIDELEAQDIDNETDWKLAELKFELLHGKK